MCILVVLGALDKFARSRSLVPVVAHSFGARDEIAHSRSLVVGLLAAVAAEYIQVGYVCQAAVVVVAACCCHIPWVVSEPQSHSCC